jgi:hypothetical protein
MKKVIEFPLAPGSTIGEFLRQLAKQADEGELTGVMLVSSMRENSERSTVIQFLYSSDHEIGEFDGIVAGLHYVLHKMANIRLSLAEVDDAN